MYTDMTAPPRNSAAHQATTGPSLLQRLFDDLDAAMGEARARTDLRRRLRADANIRRDLGVTRFQMLRLTDRS